MASGQKMGAREGVVADCPRPAFRWPDAPPGQMIRDKLLAYFVTPRLVGDIARHIGRPVPTTTGHLAAMRRLGMVERLGYAVYGPPGYTGELPVHRRTPPSLPLSVRCKVREAMRQPISFPDLVARTKEPEDVVRSAVRGLWMAGLVAGDEQTGYRPMRSLLRA